MKLTLGYVALLVLLTAVPPLAVVVGPAKWVPTLFAGLFAGALSTEFAAKEAAIGTAVFALLLSLGWTLFSAMGNGLPVERTVVLLAASLPVMAVGSLWAFCGLWLVHQVKQRLARRSDSP